MLIYLFIYFTICFPVENNAGTFALELLCVKEPVSGNSIVLHRVEPVRASDFPCAPELSQPRGMSCYRTPVRGMYSQGLVSRAREAVCLPLCRRQPSLPPLSSSCLTALWSGWHLLRGSVLPMWILLSQVWVKPILLKGRHGSQTRPVGDPILWATVVYLRVSTWPSRVLPQMFAPGMR